MANGADTKPGSETPSPEKCWTKKPYGIRAPAIASTRYAVFIEPIVERALILGYPRSRYSA